MGAPRSSSKLSLLLFSLVFALSLALLMWGLISRLLIPVERELTEQWDSESIDVDNYSQQAYIYNQQGESFWKQGRVEEAIAAYQKAISWDSSYATAYNNLGVVWLEQGKINQAIAAFEQAIRLDPLDAQPYQNLCYALHRQKKLLAAIQKCQQALSLDPSLSGVKLYLQEAQRLLAQLRYPQVFHQPEQLPSPEIEPLVSLKRSVVKIIVKGSNGTAVGTGWLWKRKGTTGWIITNRHVVKGKDKKDNPQTPEKIEVEFYSQPPPGRFRKRQPAKILRATSDSDWLDLALLKVDGLPRDIQPLTISQQLVELNTPIRVIGHPSDGEDWTVSTGQISQKTIQGMLLTADLAVGNSGSPVLNQQNQVVGVAVAVTMFCRQKTGLEALGINWDFNCALALPIESVRERLEVWLDRQS